MRRHPLLGLKPVLGSALLATTLQALAQENRLRCALLSGWRHPAWLRAGRATWALSALGDLPNSAVPNSALFNWECAADQGDPTASVSTPGPMAVAANCAGDLLPGGARSWISKERRQSLRQGPLLAALAGEATIGRPCANDLAVQVVEPEQASVRQGPARWPGRWRAGVAMSGSGAQSLCPVADQGGRRARAQLPEHSSRREYENRCCRCSQAWEFRPMIATAA